MKGREIATFTGIVWAISCAEKIIVIMVRDFFTVAATVADNPREMRARTVQQTMIALALLSVATITTNVGHCAQLPQALIAAARALKDSVKKAREIVIMTGNVKAPWYVEVTIAMGLDLAAAMTVASVPKRMWAKAAQQTMSASQTSATWVSAGQFLVD